MRKKVWIFPSVILLLTGLDFLCTYLGTPDLAMEGNPLVAVFGLGWGALFAVNIVFLLLYFLASYYTFARYRPVPCEPCSKKEYCSLLFFGRPDKFHWTLYKTPKNWAPFWAVCGYANLWAQICARSVTVFEWGLHLTNSPLTPSYNALRGVMPLYRLDLAVGCLAAVVSGSLWFLAEYKRNGLAKIPTQPYPETMAASQAQA